MSSIFEKTVRRLGEKSEVKNSSVLDAGAVGRLIGVI